MTAPSRRTARLLLVVAAVLFSTGGAAIKAATLTGWQVASFRSGVAALVIALASAEARRGWSPKALLVAAAYGATLVSYVLANKLTTAANAIFLQSAAPLYLLLIGPLLLREPVRRRDVGVVLVVAAGLALVLFAGDRAVRTAPDPALGNALAMASGLLYALAIAGLRWLNASGAGGSALASVVLGNLLASLATLPFALPVTGAGPADWGVIAYLGVVQIGIAYVCVTRAMAVVPALEASLILLVEPALNPIWAWALHGERPSPLALAGGALILAATTAASARREAAPAAA